MHIPLLGFKIVAKFAECEVSVAWHRANIVKS